MNTCPRCFGSLREWRPPRHVFCPAHGGAGYIAFTSNATISPECQTPKRHWNYCPACGRRL